MHDTRHSQQTHIAVGIHEICENAAIYDDWHSLGVVVSQRRDFLQLYIEILTLRGVWASWTQISAVVVTWVKIKVCLNVKWVYQWHLLTQINLLFLLTSGNENLKTEYPVITNTDTFIMNISWKQITHFIPFLLCNT